MKVDTFISKHKAAKLQFLFNTYMKYLKANALINISIWYWSGINYWHLYLRKDISTFFFAEALMHSNRLYFIVSFSITSTRMCILCFFSTSAFTPSSKICKCVSSKIIAQHPPEGPSILRYERLIFRQQFLSFLYKLSGVYDYAISGKITSPFHGVLREIITTSFGKLDGKDDAPRLDDCNIWNCFYSSTNR